MVTTPTGIMSLPINYLRYTLADVTAFRTWAGAADQAAALAKIFVEATETFTLPFALVTWDNNFQRYKSAGGSRNFYQQNGDLLMIFREAISMTTVPAIQDSAYTALNNIGAFISGMEVLSGQPGYLDIASISLVSMNRLLHSEKASRQADFWETVLRVSYQGVAP